MSSPLEILRKSLSDIEEIFDESSEMICINDMSKGGLPYYKPDEFNEAYLNYIYEKIKSNDLFTETSNNMQAHLISNAIYLDGDWFFNEDISSSDYLEIATKLAVDYKKRWETELNEDCISFVFLPESFNAKKGGFHVMIITKNNVSKSARIEIYNRIKSGFDKYVLSDYGSLIDVKSDGIRPYTVQDYNILFDIGPTTKMITLLPFAQKNKGSRRYILNLENSSSCIRECNLPFFLNGIYYENKTTMQVSSAPSLAKRIDEDSSKFESAYVELVKKNYGNELNVFGRRTGKLFAEFIQSLIYLSPNHLFWKKLSNHDDRLRFIFEPFIEMVCLSYFIDSDGSLPNRDDIILATAKLFHPLLKTTVKNSSAPHKRRDFQYVYEQIEIAYDKFARIPEKYTENERNLYRHQHLHIAIESDSSIPSQNEKKTSLLEENTRLEVENNELANKMKLEIKDIRDDIIKDKKNIAKQAKKAHTIEDWETYSAKIIEDEKQRLRKEKMSEDEISKHIDEFKKTKRIEYDEAIEAKNKSRELDELLNKRKLEIELKYKNLIENNKKNMASIKTRIKQLDEDDKKHKTRCEENAMNKFKEQMEKTVNGWVAFVKNTIMANMSDEIKPFTCHNCKEPFAYVESPANNREDIGIRNIRPENPDDPSSKSFYNRVMRIWTRHFLLAVYYDSRTSKDAIAKTISSLIRNFIYINNSSSGKELFVYNYQQTRELSDFPYNQWIIDKPESERSYKVSGIRTSAWMKKIYIDFIKPEFETSTINHQIRAMMEMISQCVKVFGGKSISIDKSLSPIGDLDKDFSSIFDNVMAYQSNEELSPEEVGLDYTNTTFGRNGKISFDADGIIHYSLKENHDIFSRGCTNIIFDENYDKNRPEFKKVEHIFKTTFPIESIREYVERLIASVFVGGLHDVFAIMIGSGSEGKSVFCNLILSMLGSDSIGQVLKERREGYEKLMAVKNPKGLSGSLKSEALLSTQTGHDEDGIYHAKDKRFITMQEPPKKNYQCLIHTDVIKKMTSGTATDARGIFKGKQAFIINAVPVLQTNVPPSFDTDDDAIRRRIVVIPMLAKFYTAVNNERARLQYSAEADPDLNGQIERDIYLAQATFYYLLPRISEIIRKKWIPTSQIPIPQKIKDETDRIFTDSNGLAGWIGTRIRRSDKDCLQLNKIVQKAIRYHNIQTRDRRSGASGILSEYRASNYETEIINQVFTKYGTYIYSLKPEYYDNGQYGRYTIKEGIINELIEFTKSSGYEMAKQKYAGDHPVSGPSDSKRRVSSPRYDDLILFGYTFDDDADISDDIDNM